MAVTFPEIRVGQPSRHGGLAVFPLFAAGSSPLAYQLADEAIGAGTAVVEEVTESGSVPDLAVDNRSDACVLLLEGEELRGAKQNRVLNTTVLIAARQKIKIPVSCVERGRWRYTTRGFGSSGTRCSSKLLYALKGSVSRSLRQRRGHGSDQGQVWAEVDRQQAALGTDSFTAALADTYEDYREKIAEFQQQLPYVEGATGAAVAVGKRVVSVDLFDKPGTCQKVWNRILSGLVLDVLEGPAESAAAEPSDVEQLVGRLPRFAWERVEQVGAGEEYRAAEEGLLASALVYEGVPLHTSVVAQPE